MDAKNRNGTASKPGRSARSTGTGHAIVHRDPASTGVDRMARDTAGRVIDRYHEALKKLERH